MEYRFKKITQKEFYECCPSSSKIRGVNGNYREPDYWDRQVLVLGQMMTLFGEPEHSSSDCEEEYGYYIRAEGDGESAVCLSVYSASSGPSIGGSQTEESREAADALAEMITAAQPSDYDYIGIYWDGPSLVKKGVKQGSPYYEEEELSPEDETSDLQDVIKGRGIL